MLALVEEFWTAPEHLRKMPLSIGRWAEPVGGGGRKPGAGGRKISDVGGRKISDVGGRKTSDSVGRKTSETRGSAARPSSQEGDVYGVAIILKEIFARNGPYTELDDFDPDGE